MNEILTIKEVAELCAVAPSTVQYWERKGLLPAFKTLGGHRRFQREEVLRFVNIRGRRLSHFESEKILAAQRARDRRINPRIGLAYTARVELMDGIPDARLVCGGTLVDVSMHGFAVLLRGLDFPQDTLRSILNKYHNVKVWVSDEVGFLRSPLEGTIVNTIISEDEVRVGSRFADETVPAMSDENKQRQDI
ncbi:MAG: hypothetical protein A2268_02725 [Candidatus Raymondbacteria bacterium RifOxyA12_full_50_37]|uniref:HTH merR-type domain-containing protein n=1 Tax=Candidatus Raymondbacteria bacterium RIFOXYD12_FULL_49_13 TaxID=1817890 RepID=A0A1F7FJ29_UNCRA|nr:MAG: hypothetical protein A2268_02725 [Candidatus Raymondbacteria bacterium RifOxyA12_full_50_37]OGJ90599.1 MAG: hypothetical protein A2248_02385 [Candidatus Raymondbacteria bacterium RIFOXYA2_FULL_49_16]OGK02408.1 MAG: hypothetical protein A2350_13515 [Candidatus Raymondbacteria bacterium RifOxyB12_full_50_8]OGK06137.1 MAG: hypothetical protein A2487_18845 [Candidatus Raymondbacteria bacterium RifOxyC12_full_50_8]OGK06719.1 MAG: hypothetical protein A2519_21545 [Candidatus Raymondbacteria b